MSVSSWIVALPAVFTAVLLILIPGAPVALLLRFRGLSLAAASIAASLAIIAIASLVAPLTGMRWSIVPVVIVAAVTIAVAGAAQFLLGTRPPAASTLRAGWLLTAVGLAASIVGVQLMRGIGDAASVSQTYDAVFHLNAVTQILSTGDASPLNMDLSTPGEPSIYPTVWHASVALIAQLAGASVPVATNAFVLTAAAVIWPVAILFLSRIVFARRATHLVLSAILVGSFSAFPLLLTAWGVLYPNLLSTALIPVALAFLLLALRLVPNSEGIHPLSVWVGLTGALGAATLAHPNAFFGFAVVSIAPLATFTFRVYRANKSILEKAWRFGLVGFTLLLYLAIWAAVTTADNSRTYEDGPVPALISALGMAPMLLAQAWFVSVLVILGITILLVTRSQRWIIVTFLVTVFFYVVSSGLDGPVRDIFTSPWYNDAHRLAALIPIAGILLAGITASWVSDSVSHSSQNMNFSQLSPRAQKYAPHTLQIGLAALILAGGVGEAMKEQMTWIRHLHSVHDESPLLSEDELKLIDQLDSIVPSKSKIAGNPWTGTAFAMTLSDSQVLFPHFKGSYGGGAEELAKNFHSLGDAACPIIDDLGVDFMMDFEGPIYMENRSSGPDNFVGLNQLEDSALLTEAAREGDAVLYEITGC